MQQPYMRFHVTLKIQEEEGHVTEISTRDGIQVSINLRGGFNCTDENYLHLLA